MNDGKKYYLSTIVCIIFQHSIIYFSSKQVPWATKTLNKKNTRRTKEEGTFQKNYNFCINTIQRKRKRKWEIVAD